MGSSPAIRDRIVFSKIKLQEYLQKAFPEYEKEEIEDVIEAPDGTMISFKDCAKTRAEQYLEIDPSLTKDELLEKLMGKDYFFYDEAEKGVIEAMASQK